MRRCTCCSRLRRSGFPDGAIAGGDGTGTRRSSDGTSASYGPRPPSYCCCAPSVTRPGPTGGPQKALRIINNSETDTATVESPNLRAVKDKSETDKGKPGFVESGNRDHIDQDAQTDIKKLGKSDDNITNGIGGTGGGRYTFKP